MCQALCFLSKISLVHSKLSEVGDFIFPFYKWRNGSPKWIQELVRGCMIMDSNVDRWTPEPANLFWAVLLCESWGHTGQLQS